MKTFLITVLLVAGFWAVGEMQEDQAANDSVESLNRLEWRGILALPGEMLFSLHDKETKESFWIALNEARADFEVVDYSRDENEVTVRHGEATRTFSLSGSSVTPLEEGDEPAAEGVAPVVETEESVVVSEEPAEEAEAAEESAEEEESAAGEEPDLWRQAIEESPELREIDERFGVIDAEEREVQEVLSRVAPGDPDYEVVTERQRELKEERRLLTELALTEVRVSPTLSNEIKEDLQEELRADYTSRMASPRPASSEPEPGEQRNEGGLSAEEDFSPDDD